MKIKLIAICGFFAMTAILAMNAFTPKASGQTVSGAELYQNNCARCHGADGTGGKGPNLASEKKQAKWRDSDEKLIKKITNGGMFMPSFGKKLKTDEIKAIAAHVRSLK